MSTTSMQRVLARAFAKAEESRKAVGLKPRPTPLKRTRDGSTWVGPKRYRVTVWFEPAEYLDVLERRHEAGFKGSLYKFIVATTTGGRARTAERRKLRAVG